MVDLLTLSAGGTLGTNVGPGSVGCIVGTLLPTAASKALLKSLAQPVICVTQDAGLFTNETTAANESTADDVEVLGTTIAVGDAIYFGHATKTFVGVDINVTTEGNYATTTFVAEYWDGSAWTEFAVSATYDTVLDGEGTGIVSCTHDVPEDWDTIGLGTDTGTVEGYFMRIRCTATAGTTTPCQIGQAWVVMDPDDAVFTDDTTDFNDAGTGDVALLGASNVKVGDGFYIGHATEQFCKVAVTTSQARTGTATLTLKYWDGDSWTAIPEPVTDDSAGWATTAGVQVIGFEPPSDWAICTTANGPDGNAGYFIVMEVTALTDVTQQPLATIGYVFPLTTGAIGVRMPRTGTIVRVDCSALTISAANADSRFLLINATQGSFYEFTWTGAVADQVTVDLGVNADDEIVLVQVQEDGTTEFAGASFYLTMR